MMGIDTHCLLRYSMRDQVKEHAAIEARIFKAVEANDEIFINNIVLSAFFWVLESNYKFSQAMVLNAISGLLEVQHLGSKKSKSFSRRFTISGQVARVLLIACWPQEICRLAA